MSNPATTARKATAMPLTADLLRVLFATSVERTGFTATASEGRFPCNAERLADEGAARLRRIRRFS